MALIDLRLKDRETRGLEQVGRGGWSQASTCRSVGRSGSRRARASSRPTRPRRTQPVGLVGAVIGGDPDTVGPRFPPRTRSRAWTSTPSAWALDVQPRCSARKGGSRPRAGGRRGDSGVVDSLGSAGSLRAGEAPRGRRPCSSQEAVSPGRSGSAPAGVERAGDEESCSPTAAQGHATPRRRA